MTALARLLLLALLATVTAASPGRAAGPAGGGGCGGRDLLPELLERDPAAKGRIEDGARAVPNGEALLWRIGKQGIAKGHLFGTVHLSDERVTRLSPAVASALQEAKTVALEVADLSPSAFVQALGQARDVLMLGDGRTLAGMLGPDELASARKAGAAAGLPAQLLEAMRPWVLTTLLAIPACERERVKSGRLPLDHMLAERAKAEGRTVVGLETLEEQLRALARVPEADQVVMLKAGLKTLDRADDLMETTLLRYLAREVGMVWPLQLELARATGFEPARFASFHRELIGLRNQKMRDAALPLIASGGVFIAVGALHLVGDDGLVALLRQEGFEVTAVE